MASSNKRRLLGAVIVVAFVALCVLTAMSISKALGNDESKGVELQSIAGTFPAPIDARILTPDVVSDSGDEVVRTWTTPVTIDAACQTWREAYRTWIGSADVGSVTGESIPGQSCIFRGNKSGHPATLTVAVYAGAPPQATLSLKD